MEEFDDLEPGAYWFVIADAAVDGICCSHGDGYVRIVELKWYQAVTAERDHIASSTVEERVLWESNGQFQAYTDAHLRLS